MTTKKIAFTVLLAGTVLGAVGAQAAVNNNPLHPSYFTSKAMVAAPMASGGVAANLPVRNPLDPRYVWKDAGGEFVGTANAGTQPYLDRGNPLYPGYQRI